MRLLLAEDEKELSSFWSFLVISIVGILVVFALVLIFSKIAVKPFAESYEKRKRFITDASHEIKHRSRLLRRTGCNEISL